MTPDGARMRLDPRTMAAKLESSVREAGYGSSNSLSASRMESLDTCTSPPKGES
jgi:hypothetical protein